MLAEMAAQMHTALGALVRATTSTPIPTPTLRVDPDLVTPGPWGFAVIAFLTLAVILLILDMMRRIRRARFRAEINEQLDAEEQASGEDEPPKG